MWKPIGKMDCVDLGHNFFLVKFLIKKDNSKVFKGGPWFVEGHYLFIRYWEPNFRSSTANMSSMAVWILLLELRLSIMNPHC